MLFYLLNKSFQKIGVIDNYESVIWTTRFQDVGEFELYLPSNDPNQFQTGQFLLRNDNDSIMIIEHIYFTTDEEKGDYCTVTGKSLEKILSQRIVWDKTEMYGRIEECIYRLVDENIINADNSLRNISNIKCAKSKGLTTIGKFTFNGESLLDVIVELCSAYNFGFKITTNLTFEIYVGTDRSYNQTLNPYVIFSPNFDNLSQSTYENDISDYKNVCLVYSETSKTNRGYVHKIIGEGSGINRRETFVDSGGEDSDEALSSRGSEALSEAKIIEIFDGQIETSYKYGEDYFLGDIVQIENEYGKKATAQIIEIIENLDESGYKCIPTFKTLEVS